MAETKTKGVSGEFNFKTGKIEPNKLNKLVKDFREWVILARRDKLIELLEECVIEEELLWDMQLGLGGDGDDEATELLVTLRQHRDYNGEVTINGKV